MVLVSHWGSAGSSRFWASAGFHSPRNYIRPSPILLCFHFLNFFKIRITLPHSWWVAPARSGTRLLWIGRSLRCGFVFVFFFVLSREKPSTRRHAAYTFHHSPISETFLLLFCFHAHAARYSNLCVEYGGILCQLSLHEHVGCGWFAADQKFTPLSSDKCGKHCCKLGGDGVMSSSKLCIKMSFRKYPNVRKETSLVW